MSCSSVYFVITSTIQLVKNNDKLLLLTRGIKLENCQSNRPLCWTSVRSLLLVSIEVKLEQINTSFVLFLPSKTVWQPYCATTQAALKRNAPHLLHLLSSKSELLYLC